MIVPLKFVNFGNIPKPNEHILMYLIDSFKRQGFNITITNNDKDAKVILCSVFPNNLNSIRKYSKNSYFKILFIGENTKERFKSFDNINEMKKEFHVVLSLSRYEDDVYMRVPNWIYYYDFHMKEKSNMYNFITYCIENDWYTHSNVQPIEDRIKACSMVAKSDFGGRRSKFVNTCKSFGVCVKSPSVLCNNDKPIGKKPQDKHDYIKKFLFNICPENSFADGYCTEKLFQAIVSGCIPIYWGDPENEVFFNKERIIYCKNAINNDYINDVELIKELIDDKDKLEKMFLKPLFTKNALKEIDKYVNKFDKIAKKYKDVFIQN